MIKLVIMLYLFIASNCSKPSRLRKKQPAAYVVESRLAMDEIMNESTKTQRQKNPNLTRQDSSRPLCRAMKMDVQIVVDGSDSVTEQNFKNLNRLIAEDLIGVWDISPNTTRVAYTFYSEHPAMEFLLDGSGLGKNKWIMVDEACVGKCAWRQKTDKEMMQGRVKSTSYRGGRRLTGKALMVAFNQFYYYDMRKSPDVLKTLIFFTNGETDKADTSRPEIFSKAWNIQVGAKVFAVGIGNDISQKGLRSIAGSYGRTLRINSYAQKDIDDVLHKIKEALCHSQIDFQNNFPIRLAGGTDMTGRVEILYAEHWGSICTEYGRPERRIKFSKVVCRQLGLGPPVTHAIENFGQGNGRILLDYVDCIGNETNIGQCHHRGAHGISHCPDGNITGVSCSYPLRLAHEWRENYHEGRNRIEFVGGLPESKHKGEWGTMCVKDAKCTAEYLDVAENAVDSKRCRDVAQVVCKGLGYSSGDPDAPEDERRNKARDHRIVLTVECNGRQGENFADCQKEEWKQGDCDWNEVLFVYCHNE